MGAEEEMFAFLDDLEQRAEALYDAERAPDVADRSRSAYRQVVLASRLMASIDSPLTVSVSGFGPVSGTLDRIGAGWCLLTSPGQAWVVRLAAVVAVVGASDRAVPEMAWSPLTRLGIGSVLRRLADAGETCVVHGIDGSRHDGALRRVGADFVEVVVGEAPGRMVLVALDGISAVQYRESS